MFDLEKDIEETQLKVKDANAFIEIEKIDIFADNKLNPFEGYECDSSDFNILEIVLKNKKEDRITQLIKAFLDINALHGYKDQFLKLFIQEIESYLGNRGLQDRYLFNIHQEYVTQDFAGYKREDLLLDFLDFGIGIELKPFPDSSDGKKQLENYAKDLKFKYGNDFLLIYISHNGKQPEEKSISSDIRKELEENKKFLVMPINNSDQGVLKWLEEIKLKEDDVYMEIIKKHFIEHLKKI